MNPLTNSMPDPRNRSDDQVTMALIGHSTVLMNVFGTWILTDPVFSHRIGVKLWPITIGPARHKAPILSLDEIPKVDCVLLSHAHMDHTDLPSLRALVNKFPGHIECIVASHNADLVKRMDFASVTELDRWQKKFAAGAYIRALQVDHRWARVPFVCYDRAKGHIEKGRSYNGYLIEKNGVKIVFAWDTANTDIFTELAGEQIDIALMPIGSYQNTEKYHCDPVQAIQMAKDMHAKVVLPIHFGTFHLDLFNEPVHHAREFFCKIQPQSGITVGWTDIGETYVY